MDELARWLELFYERAYRSAWLILGDRADAEEAVQEAFLRAWRFRASMPSGEGVRPWLYRVVVNTCCSKLRAEIPHRSRRAEASELDELAGGLADPQAEAERADSASAVLAALEALPDPLRIPVVLRYWADLPERDIATAIGRRPGTVKSRLHEARRRLATEPALGLLGEEAL